MSKPNLPGGESLEDILASIRKTLADDRPDDGVARLDSLELTGPADLAPPANGGAPHDVAHDAPKAGDTLPNRLANALNGGSNGHAEEADLADLLESELPATAPTPKQPANGTEARDPLWFLSRDTAAADADPKSTAARERAAEPPAQVPAKVEEIALTRPETLRRSFPPLFGGGEASPTRPADLPFERPKPPEPATPTPAPVVTADKPAAPASAATWPTPVEAEKPSAAPVAKSAPAAAARAPFMPEPAAEVAAKTVAWDVPAPAPKPELKPELRAEPKAEAKAEPVAALPAAAADTKSESAAAGTQGPPLQEVIARLLEPVIQQWLDTNLPRMVEAAIREEVARQAKGVRGDQKI